MIPGARTSPQQRRCLLAAVVPAALALAGCGGSHSATPAPPVRHTPLVSIFEAQAQLFRDPPGTLDLLRRLGANVVRIEVPWASLAPDPTSRTPPAHFRAGDPASYPAPGWAPYDAIVRAAQSRGIGVYLTLGPPPPLWAGGLGAPESSGRLAADWRPSTADFRAFVRAMGTRYSGSYTPPGQATPLPRVSFWSIWNEPNYGQDLAPQSTGHSAISVSPGLYRGLLDAAWKALQRTGHGADTILIGEIAPRGTVGGDLPGDFGGMVPLRFVRALYCVGSAWRPLRGAAATVRGCPPDAAGSAEFARLHPALFDATGFAVHPYPHGLPPTVATTGVEGSADYADLPQLPKLEQLLDRAAKLYGAPKRLPLYSTEFGYKTTPPIPGGVGPTTAAAYLNWAEYVSWADPRIRSYDQYLLVDPQPNAKSTFVTGLYYATGAPKPSFFAYRMPIFLPTSSAPSGHELDVWGCVRPARFARLQTGAPQVVQIQFQAPGARSFATVRRVTLTDPYGYFDVPVRFRGTGLVRLRWSYPDGTTIFSRSATVTIR
ncbi:MAG: hypothetical protein ACR2L9_10770 [Solirubrobacteraceae bacterium]